MERHYSVTVEPAVKQDVFIATCPALAGVVEQGNTEEEAFKNMGAAMRFTLDSMVEEGEKLPPSDIQHTTRTVELII
jgi:predicted RNase H-like HicB family nuclease